MPLLDPSHQERRPLDEETSDGSLRSRRARHDRFFSRRRPGAAAAEKAIMPSTTRAERAIRSFFIEGSPFLVRWVQERHVTGLGLHDRASSILLSVLVADLFAWCMQPLIVLLLVSV